MTFIFLIFFLTLTLAATIYFLLIYYLAFLNIPHISDIMKYQFDLQVLLLCQMKGFPPFLGQNYNPLCNMFIYTTFLLLSIYPLMGAKVFPFILTIVNDYVINMGVHGVGIMAQQVKPYLMMPKTKSLLCFQSSFLLMHLGGIYDGPST